MRQHDRGRMETDPLPKNHEKPLWDLTTEEHAELQREQKIDDPDIGNAGEKTAIKVDHASIQSAYGVREEDAETIFPGDGTPEWSNRPLTPELFRKLPSEIHRALQEAYGRRIPDTGSLWEESLVQELIGSILKLDPNPYVQFKWRVFHEDKIVVTVRFVEPATGEPLGYITLCPPYTRRVSSAPKPPNTRRRPGRLASADPYIPEAVEHDGA